MDNRRRRLVQRTILNLSSRGLFMATHDDLPALGESLRLKFAVGHAESPETVTIKGTVKRLWNPAVEGDPGGEFA